MKIFSEWLDAHILNTSFPTQYKIIINTKHAETDQKKKKGGGGRGRGEKKQEIKVCRLKNWERK